MGPREWLSTFTGHSKRDSGDKSVIAHYWNDVEVRSDIIERHYDGISSTHSRKIAEILCKEFTQGGTSARGMADEVMEHTSLSEERTFEIVNTERTAMSNLRKVQAYSERDDFSHHVFRWIGPNDHRTTEICRGIKCDIESQGGAVPLDTLRSLIKGHAEQHENGTPERYDEFCPHRECRHTLNRQVIL